MMDRTSSVVEIADLDKETIPSTMSSDGDEDADLHKSSSSSTFCMERSSFLMSTPVNESQESVHDDDTHYRSTLIFKENLVNHLTYKMVKGKVKLKWTGLLRELKEFVVLILEKDGHWHTRQQGGVEVNVFDHAKSKFKLTWWSSTGTFTVQGNEKICHDIVKKVQNLVDDKAENSVKTGETTKAGKQKRENPLKRDEIELKVNEFQSYLGDELKKMWSAIESIQRALTHASKSECKQKDVLSFPNVPTSNRFQYLIETTPSKIEKNDENHFAGSSNKEEIEKLKKAVLESKKKVDELERKLKDKEAIIKMLKTDCERLKTEKVKVRSEDVSSTKRSTNLSRNNQENAKNTGVTNKNVSAAEKAENQSTEKNKRKPKIFLVGDSMVHDIKGWLLSRNKTVKVCGFPGSTTEDMGVTNKNVSASEKAENQSTEKNKRKPKIFLVGDSMVHDIKGWLLSRNKTVKVYGFPGSTTEDMESFLIPLLKRKPDQILLHVGTNDLKSYSPQQVADKILDLTKLVNSYGIRCSVSEIIKRDNYLSTKGQEVNRILSTILPEQVSLISHHNISEQHLNRSGSH